MELLQNKNIITSLELVEQINFFRAIQKEKFPEDRLFSNTSHDSLLKIIREEFSEEINEGEINEVNYLDKKGEKRPCFNLTLNQAKQVLIRESKVVRKAVVLYIEKLEQKLGKPKPKTQIELIIESALVLQNHESRLSNLETKINNLEESKQEALLQLNYIERSTQEVPEISVKDKIRELVNSYAKSNNIPYSTVWKSMYEKLYYIFHFSVNAHKKLHDKESLLDICERKNQLDNLFAICSKELI